MHIYTLEGDAKREIKLDFPVMKLLYAVTNQAMLKAVAFRFLGGVHVHIYINVLADRFLLKFFNLNFI